MLIVVGYVQIDPADLNEFTEDLKFLAMAARRRPGNISRDRAIDDQQSGRLLVAERWADEMSLSAHLCSDVTVAFVNRWRRRMKSDVRKYDASNERALAED
ncbi:putative quinol monooxygenase [Agrobacterium larrymoorei]|uniref:Antibiotic biosynthesis monooxygenase n=1 Tax=Agrobacterium larrymoorei TaxID=160699 RepID=A0A4D7DTD2_9HYPH|nr:antibiotic biosynthesis monooxygenase [Agrobacterium larrymoorei]QCJ00706.1 antibiotic biosynthesis monooxygenase [Agrobacterium larrymoorei]QYA10707.1 antibiotic biosynthesis monooxygenase [Agrobacterium larrymoorei]